MERTASSLWFPRIQVKHVKNVSRWSYSIWEIQVMTEWMCNVMYVRFTMSSWECDMRCYERLVLDYLSCVSIHLYVYFKRHHINFTTCSYFIKLFQKRVRERKLDRERHWFIEDANLTVNINSEVNVIWYVNLWITLCMHACTSNDRHSHQVFMQKVRKSSHNLVHILINFSDFSMILQQKVTNKGWRFSLGFFKELGR